MLNKTKFACNFCKNEFVSKYNLKLHTETAIYCLNLRGETIANFKCDYCDSDFTQKSNLTAHLKICKELKILQQEQEFHKLKKLETSNKNLANLCLKERQQAKEYETTIDELNNFIVKKDVELANANKIINELKIHVNELESELKNITKIHSVELELYKEKGRNIELSKTKPTQKITNTINNIINAKLSKLPIDNIWPLTVDYVKEKAPDYTYKMYIGGIDKLIKFIISLVVLQPKNCIKLKSDDVTERNYACTDTSRDKFHRLEKEKIWEPDVGAKFIHTILDELQPYVRDYQDRVNKYERSAEYAIEYPEGNCRISSRVINMRAGILDRGSEEGKDLFIKIKGALRDVVKI